MEQILFECKNCGASLTRKHLHGIFLQCPNIQCNKTYIYQNGIVSESISKYFQPVMNWDDCIKKVFNPLLAQLPIDIFSEMKVIVKKEVYIPYLDVTTPEKETLFLPIAKEENETGWQIDDLPIIQSTQQFSSYKYTEEYSSSTTSIAFVQQDQELQTKIQKNMLYVEPGILYIPIKFFFFNYKGTIHKFVAYGNMVENLTGSIQNILLPIVSYEEIDDTPRKIFVKVCLSSYPVLIAASWIILVYPYQQTHGFWNLIKMLNGNQRLFNFALAMIICFIVPAIAVKFFDKARYYKALCNRQNTISQIKKDAQKIFHIELDLE